MEGIIFRNRGQIEGILKGNREQNLFVYVQRFKGPAIPKHRLPSKYTIVETPSGTIWNINKVTKKVHFKLYIFPKFRLKVIYTWFLTRREK